MRVVGQLLTTHVGLGLLSPVLETRLEEEGANSNSMFLVNARRGPNLPRVCSAIWPEATFFGHENLAVCD